MLCRSTASCRIRRAPPIPARPEQIRDALAYMNLAPRPAPDRHPRRPRLHRLLHQRPYRGSARRRGGARRAQGAGSRGWSRRVFAREAAGRGGGARSHLQGSRARMGRERVLDVRRHQRRSGASRRALRLDHEPQLQGPPGTRRPHPPHVARDGGGRGGRRPSRRCAAADRREGLWSRCATSPASPVRSRSRTSTRTRSPGALPTAARSEGLRAGAVPRHAVRHRREAAAGVSAQPAGVDGAASLSPGGISAPALRAKSAVYALVDYGVRCVIAPSFGDIFAANAVNNGLLPARVSEAAAEELIAALSTAPRRSRSTSKPEHPHRQPRPRIRDRPGLADEAPERLERSRSHAQLQPRHCRIRRGRCKAATLGAAAANGLALRG